MRWHAALLVVAATGCHSGDGRLSRLERSLDARRTADRIALENLDGHLAHRERLERLFEAAGKRFTEAELEQLVVRVAPKATTTSLGLRSPAIRVEGLDRTSAVAILGRLEREAPGVVVRLLEIRELSRMELTVRGLRESEDADRFELEDLRRLSASDFSLVPVCGPTCDRLRAMQDEIRALEEPIGGDPRLIRVLERKEVAFRAEIDRAASIAPLMKDIIDHRVADLTLTQGNFFGGASVRITFAGSPPETNVPDRRDPFAPYPLEK
jgi:hypothetical protein